MLAPSSSETTDRGGSQRGKERNRPEDTTKAEAEARVGTSL